MRICFAHDKKFVCSALASGLAILFLSGLPARADYDVPSYDDGMDKMSRRDFDGAILEFNRAIGYNNRNGKAFFKRGQCFYYLQNFQLAVDDFTAAISCNPRDSELYLWRGATYCKMGDDPHSIKDYVVALRLDAKLLEAAKGAAEEDKTGLKSPMFKHGPAGKKNVNEQSIKNYKEAVHIVEENIMPQFAPGPVFSGIVRPEFSGDRQAAYLRPKALDEISANPKAVFEACRKRLETNPRDPETYFKRALALELLGKTQKALEDMAEAISPQSNSAEVLLARAYLHHLNHDDMAAGNDISRAHALDPEVPAVISWPDKQ